MLSLLAFDPEYLSALIEIGEADAAARADEIRTLLGVENAGAQGQTAPGQASSVSGQDSRPEGKLNATNRGGISSFPEIATTIYCFPSSI